MDHPPPVPLDTLTLKRATSAQTRLCREHTWVEWNCGLTLEQYTHKDLELDKATAAGERLTQWVLVPRDDPDTESAIFASCQTYQRKVAISSPSSEEVVTGKAYAIAAVFVQPHLRKNGYGSHMMRLMHHVLASPVALPAFPKEWGEPPLEYFGDAILSVLYSDIGEFYTRLGPSTSSESMGWKITNKRSTTWKTAAYAPLPRSIADVKLLTEADLKEILAQDEDEMLRELFHPPLREAKRFTFFPADGPIEWQIRRFKLLLPKRHPDGYEPDDHPRWPPVICGAHFPSPFSSNLAFATWTYDFRAKPTTLRINRMRCDQTSLPKLVGEAMDEASKLGLEQVEVYGLPDDLLETAAGFGGETFEREKHWPSLAWYGSPEDKVEWANNEFFSWC